VARDATSHSRQILAAVLCTHLTDRQLATGEWVLSEETRNGRAPIIQEKKRPGYRTVDSSRSHLWTAPILT
jgi:hypothetical protein